MNYREFFEKFYSHRAVNGYKNREYYRDLVRRFRDEEETYDGTLNQICRYILSQEKPMVFLDNLFAKDGELKKRDEIRLNSEKNKEKMLEVEKEKEFEQQQINTILDTLYDYVVKNNCVPKINVLSGLVSFKVNKYFTSENQLLKACRERHSDVGNYLFNETSFTSQYEEETNRLVNKYKKFFVTTAVSGKRVDENFYKSIKTFCQSENALCLVMPCEDIMNRKTAFKWNLDSRLKDDNFRVIFHDTYLNSNLFLSDIKVSAKMINPSVGLPQFTQEGSVIIASPKQELDYVANSMDKYPNAIMTTGAMTEPDYVNDIYMSHRLSKIAEYDHVMGGIIVEILNDERFNFRQVQVDKTGVIYDMDSLYTPEYKKLNMGRTVAVLGDLHVGETDMKIFEKATKIIKEVGCQEMVVHDLFSGISIKHWDFKKPIKLAQKYEAGNMSLKDEAQAVEYCLEELTECAEHIYVAESNHHDFLMRYLEEKKWINDVVNFRYVLDIVKAVFDGETNPVKYMIENLTKRKYDVDRVFWLENDETLNINGVELAQHGHLGANGAKGNLNTYRKAYKKSVSAHTHTPRIKKGAFSVGTTTKLKLDYTKGLSNWLNAFALVHENGCVQLVNIFKD